MKRILFLIPFVFIALTCSKEDLPTVGYGNKIEVQTQDITQNGLTTISIKATVNSDLPESIIEKGFCWNTTQNATINDNSLKISVSGAFNTTISGLLPGTNYSIRAYVKTTADLIYGNEVKFKTLTLPTLSTASASSITTTTAISGGNISADGGATITARGVCWNTTGSPTVANSRTQDGAGSGAFTSALSGLTPGTVYFVRAYAANSAGTAYGPEITFTTQATPVITLPTLSTASASSITTTTAISGGNISADGGATITARGVCWNTTGSPTVANSRTQDGAGSGAFTSALSGLTPGTVYFVRAYAANSAGTAYGPEITFTTQATPVITLPTLSTASASSITTTTAISGGNISADGGATITARGVCWNTTGSPTVANSRTQDGAGSGAFTSALSGLTPGTVYFVRAYAANSAGTAYGPEITFTTQATPVITLPTLSTASASSITTTTAISGGNISADGGATITARGVCWNTTGSPTVANSRTQDGAGSGAFTSALSGLTPGTVYFVRAYAANSAGTAYGPEITFTTQAPEICTITSITNGTVYSMQAPATGTIVNAGSSYKITMASPIFSFGQASEVAIFRNETKVFSFGTFLLFNETPGNARTFTIPAGLVSSSCYTIRVTKPEGTITAVYVSPRFEIR